MIFNPNIKAGTIVHTPIENNLLSSKSLVTSYENSRVTEVGYYAFYMCTSLKTVSFPNVKYISASSFEECTSLESVSFPKAVAIYYGAFLGCTSLLSVSAVSFPLVEEVGGSVFYNCTSLRSCHLKLATTIGSSAFSNCSSLQNCFLNSVTSIGSGAFENCSSLTDIWLENTSGVCEYKSTKASYDPPNENLQIHVPSSLLESYKTATNWSRLADHFVAIS